MEKEEIKIETPFVSPGLTLIPIVKDSINYWQGRGRFSFFGIKQPVSMVVISPQGRKAFRISGEEISLDQLTEEVPGIKEVMQNL